MKITFKPIVKKYLLRVIIGLAVFILIILAGAFAYVAAYSGKVYPNSSIAGVSVAGKNPQEAFTVLSKYVSVPPEITLNYQDQIFKIKSSDIKLSYDLSASVQNAYEFTRGGDIFNDFEKRIKLFFYPNNFNLVTSFDEDMLKKIVSIIAGQISIDSVDPSVSKVNGSILVNKGSAGKEVNQDKLISAIINNLAQNRKEGITVPVEDVDNTLNDTEAKDYASRAEKFFGKNISLKFEYDSVVLQDSAIFKLLNPKGGYDGEAIEDTLKTVAKTFERDPQNPKFVFENGKVTEFEPALDGIKIDTGQFETQLIRKLEDLEVSEEKSIELNVPTNKTPPEITTDKVNNLGINELIGRGTSTYYHSIPGRVHNISLATSRINGTLVKPGDSFSFNTALGDVSAFTGYQQAYIISGGKTILGDGGGVCQVSSTLFRALLNSGLPITERQAHAYRVSYYEQGSSPGLDATVYSPSPDLKFVNDTPGYILIEATADTKNYSLVFEIYGTSDGRVASITKPVVTGVVAPPEDLYQDDPSLPSGTIKQIDYKAWGAKVTFNYVVTRDGQEIINKTFLSNYKPWQAVYLRGTGPSQ
ncbi:MAG: VanW family protein [Candidatus Woesebacteria bacterium GW2011_GWA1_41_7]|uniref:VanW family protein n=3 Tax=Candidatus Woeseibacteriota TaxID=1752722 RepID=A0A0G0WY65_9BACT|nr:MAG: VanW family protein [Candidatus Woesebacteria bacterium GW2011_GWA1_41_7]